MKLLLFFFKHSVRDLARNRSRTLFALLCVATGVTAVVALRSLGFMVRDKLTNDLAEVNRGDIRIYASGDVPEIAELSPQGEPIFTRDGVETIRAWADAEDVEVMGARLSGGAAVRRIVNGVSEAPKTLLTFFIEPESYPFYDTVVLNEPAGTLLADAFPASGDEIDAVANRLLPKTASLAAIALGAVSGPAASGLLDSALIESPVFQASHPRPVVISSNLTRQSSLGLRLGDILRIGASDAFYVISGIVPSDAESVLSNPQTAFVDFVYLPLTDLPLLGEPAQPDQMFVKVPLGRSVLDVERSLTTYLSDTYDTGTDFDKELNRASVSELEDQNSDVADVIDKMILTMGLSSLLIGGIGIINTMLVVVNRRTLEIAVLKTLGLKGNRVTVLFMIEAALMGLVGSLIGVVAGSVLSYAVKDVGEDAFQLSLVWRLYPEAMYSGLFLGLVITVLFGFLPTLIAGQVRPAVVLRPNEAKLPTAGLLQALLAIVVMIVVLGLLVNTIVEGTIQVDPVYMLAGGGALVGLFAGIILGNMGFGNPLPAQYVFRLPRRFEPLENRIITVAAAVSGLIPVAAWRGLDGRERGRRAITFWMRAARQYLLLYGALLIGAVLASGIILVLSEIWLPAGIGTDKPSNDIYAALDQREIGWVLVWLGLTLAIGLAIRVWSRALVGLIALASLGTSNGGAAGLIAGVAARGVLEGTGVWDFLSEIAPGVVLVEGALALLGAVFVGYWLLVWAMGKLSGGALMALVSFALLVTLAVVIQAILSAGVLGLVALAVVAALYWLVVRSRRWERALPGNRIPSSAPRQSLNLVRGNSALWMGMAVLTGSFLAVDVLGPAYRRVVALVVIFLGWRLWRFLRQNYQVDGRLILREMSGRRSRTASTLLGLSVGLAGLSLVSLTTNAVSNLLEFQLDERAEGNLLVVTLSPEQGEAVTTVLDESEGVEHYSQFTVYNAVLMEINGEPVEQAHTIFGDERDDPRENSNYDVVEHGVPTVLSMRSNLAALPDYSMKSGRQLTPDDAGRPRIMVRESFFTMEYGIDTGDRLMYLFANGPGETDDVLIQLTVVGIVKRQSEQTSFGDVFTVPPGTLPDTVRAGFVVSIAQIDESSDVFMDGVLIKLADVPGAYALELGDLTQLLESLINQLKAIPTLVAWLALLAGTAIIANTVALATQERRRQIGIMKAIGLKGRRVLAMLMIENGLIGLIAGLIGLSVGLLVTVVVVLASESPSQLRHVLELSTIGWLLVLSIVVAITAALLSAWSAAAEKPMNVLRYE